MVPTSYSDRRVCVMGLGYVGLTLAVVMAEAGFDVVGVEIREDVVEQLQRGEPHFFETGLQQRLQTLVTRGRLRFEASLPKDAHPSVYIITVGTPLGDDGRVRLDIIEKVSRDVAENMTGGALVILRSTVKVGSTRKIVLPILETAGVPFDLAFCPERTIEGQALSELKALPQIVGGNSPAANIRAAQLFQFVTPTVVRVDDLETAEMIKLIDNTQRDVFFAFSNEVARICDRVGISAKEVISAGKLGYPRTNLAMPGPVGGPCLSKDSYLLVEALSEMGLPLDISAAARKVNEAQPLESVQQIRATTDQLAGFPVNPVVCLMGLAFKGRPETDDMRGTTARPILDALKDAYPDATWHGYDAMVPPDIIREFGLEPAASLSDAFNGANLVVIGNNHPAFAGMSIEILGDHMARPGLVYDFWNHFDARDLDLPEGVGYMALGAHGLAALPGIST
jgi:nucleotide sugar dehydrogenase